MVSWVEGGVGHIDDLSNALFWSSYYTLLQDSVFVTISNYFILFGIALLTTWVIRKINK